MKPEVLISYEQHMSVKFKHVLRSIIMQHRYTKTQISEQEICLSSFPAALQHILIAIHNILQKVVLCHSYVVPHCSETLAFNTKWYKIMLKRGKK